MAHEHNSIPNEIISVLTTDPECNALLNGGVYERPLDRRTTPNAFDDIYYRVAAYVVDGEEYPNIQEYWVPTASDSVPEIRLIAPTTHEGREALRVISQRCRLLFHDYVQTSDFGTKLFYRWAGRSSIVDSEEYIGASTCTVRLQVTGVISSNF